MKALRCVTFVILVSVLACFPRISPAQLTGYWPLDDLSNGTTVNLAPGGNLANVFGGVSAVFDPIRNDTVFEFDGASGSYVDAGGIPQIGVDTSFTWGFWSDSLNNGNGNNVIVGNRYSPTGADFNPQEFIKFTPTQFEYNRNAVPENFDYPDLVVGTWQYQTIVKDGSALIYMQNGVVTGVSHVTAGLNNPQPFYLGGNAAVENWNGRLDDVATWSSAVPLSSISAIAKGTATPLTAPATFTPQVVMSDHFDNATLDLTKWTPTNRGLENNGLAGYIGPTIVSGGISGSMALQLGGSPTNQYWYGDSIESNQVFDGSAESLIDVQRISLSKTGVAARSSLWVLGDDGHYLSFSQDAGETGWEWNARDDGGTGTSQPTGVGNNIPFLDSLDNDLGQHEMSIRIAPAGDPGDYNFLMYLDGVAVASEFVSNWPDTYHVILTGQARTVGDSGIAVFDDFQVLQNVPEPATGAWLLASLGLLSYRRRQRSR